jgi:hypothetical protein
MNKHLPAGVISDNTLIDTLLNKSNNWRVQCSVINTLAADKILAFTEGNHDTKRTSHWDADGRFDLLSDNGDANGIRNKTADNVKTEFITLNDNPYYMRTNGYKVDAVASDPFISQTYFTKGTDVYYLLKDEAKYLSFRSIENAWDAFRQYIKSNPVIIDEIQIISNTAEIFSEVIKIADSTPFGIKRENVIRLEDYFDPNQFQQTKIIVKKEIVLNANTVMYMNIPKETSSTFTFRIKAGFLSSDYLSDILEAEKMAYYLTQETKN